MAQAQTVEECVAPLAARVASRQGCELVHCEYVHDAGRWVLRLFIDREGGVTIDHCTRVSRELSTVLDVEDLIPRAYHLEVSSPGLDRPLNTPADYDRFRGEPVRIRTSSAVGGRRKFRGILDLFEDGVVRLTDTEGREVAIPLEEIRSARLDPRV